MSEIGDDIRSQTWWAQSASDLLGALDIEPKEGLDSRRVQEMREKYGANEMNEGRRTSLRELLWESLTSPMMMLLLTVAVVSLVLGRVREAIVMVVVVLIYVGVELYNKARSDRTMARLRELQAPRVMVLRDGERLEVDVDDVVVGDVLPLQPGRRVAADGRLLSSAGLLVDEAPLTGESTPQRKDAEADVPVDADLAERPTAIFAGTTILDGQGKVLVTAVGEETELGRVAKLTAGAEEEPTPLQQEMEDLARSLAYVAVGISVLIPLAGLLRGYDLEQMILTWLALTFLMVPGQPPVIITMALALAAFELAKKDVVVSRLRGAETLGSVTAILSDKTGTMTQNEMAMASLILGDGTLLVWKEQEKNIPLWQAFLKKALPAIPKGSRNPTDEALIEASEMLRPAPSPDMGRLVDYSGFAQREEYRSLIYEKDGQRTLYVTGSPTFILDHSKRWQCGEEVHDFTQDRKEMVRGRVDELTGQGRRVVGYAYGSEPVEGSEPADLTFVGCPALEDRLRQEVEGAIAQLRKAGIRTVMVTGDNAATARQVAQQVGLDTSTVVVGRELDDLSDRELQKRAQETVVFARVTPEQKLLLAEALKDQGEVVAVTGDGVNDAPALRTAHIGVAMGLTGTDVAREAADLVLTDDDFSHLPDGVAIGRKAYENFSKGITYYLSAKAILLTAFLVPLVLGYPFPFTPLQIIAIELLMDLASSTIFISEAAEPGLMEQAPRRRRRFLSWDVGRRILRNLAGPAVAILVVYFLSLALGYEVASARTAAFATWLLGHIVLALTLKQERTLLLERGLLANRFGFGWLLGMVGLVIVMVYAPFVRGALQTTRLSVVQWGMVVVGALAGGGWLEAAKPFITEGEKVIIR